MKERVSSKKKKDLIFYCLLLAYPLLQFTIFYIIVNANSILLAFQEYESVLDGGSGGYHILEFKNILQNFANVIQAFFGSEEVRDIKAVNVFANSFKAFGAQCFITLPLSILFSYYIFKKGFMHNAFKLALFMPQIVSNIVMCLMFRYMTSNVYSGLVNLFTGETVTGLLNNTETAFTTLIVFQVWVGFGTNVLLFSGAMSGINESVLEAGKIDGASPFKEFTNIVFPLTFPTLTVFITLMLANLFTNQLSLFSFYGSENAETEFWTMGYYLYHETIKARSGGGANYPYISALGLLITLFIAPITFGIDTLLKKYGPSVD